MSYRHSQASHVGGRDLGGQGRRDSLGAPCRNIGFIFYEVLRIGVQCVSVAEQYLMYKHMDGFRRRYDMAGFIADPTEAYTGGTNLDG